MTKIFGEHGKSGLAKIWISDLTIRDERKKPSLPCSDGRRRLCSSGRGKHHLCSPRRERIAWGFYSFLFSPVLLAFGGCQHRGEAVEGEQEGNDEPSPICPLICGELY